MKKNNFQTFTDPEKVTHQIPNDISLVVPKNDLPINQQHFLIEIPWHEKYSKLIPSEYQGFFNHVLPHLHARTTDIHTAVCLSLAPDFLKNFKDEKINRRIIYLGLILHDIGWSQLSQQEIAQSLGVVGLKLTKEAMGPKTKHAEIGAELAEELLSSFDFNPPLTKQEQRLIIQAVKYHDRPEEISGKDNIPIEVKIIMDLDHLWSFTHENFWQDTVRKGVNPKDYLHNLSNDIDGYFATEAGKHTARKLLQQRSSELDQIIS